MPLNSGIPAPDFELSDDSGASRRLSSFRGQPIILYFYPKDDTPGCTKEACNFRDDYSAYQQAGVVILGVSPDSPKAHVKFKAKYNLPFSLLADEDHAVCELYGVWGEKSMMGKKYMGVIRSHFVVDETGQLIDVQYKIKPEDSVNGALKMIGL